MKAASVKGLFWRTFLATLVVVASASAGQDAKATDSPADEPTANHPWIGQEAPAFELESTEGEAIALSRFRGEKFVVIHFAASW